MKFTKKEKQCFEAWYWDIEVLGNPIHQCPSCLSLYKKLKNVVGGKT